MRRSTVTKQRIIEMTREVLHGFYGRSVDHLYHYLSEEFIWIGAFDFQFALGKQQFLNIIQSELNAIPFRVEEEHYDLIARDRDTFILYCKCNLSGAIDADTLLQTHTRLSIVWKYIENELKLIHVHGSNAQDIPLTVKAKIDTAEVDTNDFISYITSAESKVPAAKRLFRRTSGEHCILSEDSILYLQAEGQTTRIHTSEEVILVSGLLRTHEAALSGVFFRIHKSYLVNTAYLTSFQRYQATLCNTIKLPIGKGRYLSVKQLYKQCKA